MANADRRDTIRRGLKSRDAKRERRFQSSRVASTPMAKLTAEEMWRQMLRGNYPRLHGMRRMWGALPSPPRCKLCNAPFRGPGGKLINELQGPKKMAAKLIRFDGAYLRFTGAAHRAPALGHRRRQLHRLRHLGAHVPGQDQGVVQPENVAMPLGSPVLCKPVLDAS
jgi:hypothetical protein